MVPLLRVVLTSSESLLLCFTPASVDVLSFTASVMVYSGQICKGCAGTDACTLSASQVTALISCTFPATRGEASPWRQPETNESSSKSLGFMVFFSKVAWKLCFPPGSLFLLLATLRHHRFLLESIVKPFPFLSLFRVSYNCNT